MGFKTKAEATAAGKAGLKGLPAGWTLRVWKNLGWHVALENAPFSLHFSTHAESEPWSCMISSDPASASFGHVGWTPQSACSGDTPREAVRAAADAFYAYVREQRALFELIGGHVRRVAGEEA